MGDGPVRSDARIQMYLATVQPFGFAMNPCQQSAGQTLTSSRTAGRQVVNVKVPTPSQISV